MFAHFGDQWFTVHSEKEFDGQIERFNLKRLVLIRVVDHKSSMEYRVIEGGDHVKIPTPPDGDLSRMLQNSETSMMWFKGIMVIVNPHFPAMTAKFETLKMEKCCPDCKVKIEPLFKVSP